MFFFVAAEGLPDSTPSSVLTTVPTAAERAGNFSALLPLGCPNGYLGGDSSHCANGSINPYQIFNPISAVQIGTTITRSPIPNNNLTAAGLALNPVATSYLNLYPAANVAAANADGTNNYISNSPATDSFNNEFFRVDWNMSPQSHFFIDYRRNLRVNHKFDYFNNGATGQGSTRGNRGSTIDEVYTINPTTVLDVRANWTDNYEYTYPASSTFTPATVSFPPTCRPRVAFRCFPS